MDCPNCSESVTVINYKDDIDDYGYIREWECYCPKCKYVGTYREYYKLTNAEWEEYEE